jgi:hypothetical protein
MKKLITLILLTLLCIVYNYPDEQSITLTYPNSSSNWKAGQTYQIRWTFSGLILAVSISLLNSEGTRLIKSIGSYYIFNEGFYNWQIPDNILSGNYIIKVESGSIAGLSEVFKIQGKLFEKPTVRGRVLTAAEKPSEPFAGFITSPKEGSRCICGSTITIKWSPSFSPGGDVKIQYYRVKCKGFTLGVQFYTITDSSDNNGLYQWKIPSTFSPGCYRIRISKSDVRHFLLSKTFEIQAIAGVIKKSN